MWYGIRHFLGQNWGVPAICEYDAMRDCYLFKLQGFAFYSRVARFPDTPAAARAHVMEYMWSLEIEA
jgi:hypothetical protein